MAHVLHCSVFRMSPQLPSHRPNLGDRRLLPDRELLSATRILAPNHNRRGHQQPARHPPSGCRLCMRGQLPPMHLQRGPTLTKSSYLQLMPTLDHGAVCRNAKNTGKPRCLAVESYRLISTTVVKTGHSLGRRSWFQDAAEVWPGNLHKGGPNERPTRTLAARTMTLKVSSRRLSQCSGRGGTPQAKTRNKMHFDVAANATAQAVERIILNSLDNRRPQSSFPKSYYSQAIPCL